MSKIIISDTQEIDVNFDGIIFNSGIAESDRNDIISRLQEETVLVGPVLEEDIELPRQYELDNVEQQVNLLQEIDVTQTVVLFTEPTRRVRVFPPNQSGFTAENLIRIESIIRSKYSLPTRANTQQVNPTVQFGEQTSFDGTPVTERTTIRLPPLPTTTPGSVTSNNTVSSAETQTLPENDSGFFATLTANVIWAITRLWNFVTYSFGKMYRFVSGADAPTIPVEALQDNQLAVTTNLAGNNVANSQANAPLESHSWFSVAAWTPSWLSARDSSTQNVATETPSSPEITNRTTHRHRS